MFTEIACNKRSSRAKLLEQRENLVSKVDLQIPYSS